VHTFVLLAEGHEWSAPSSACLRGSVYFRSELNIVGESMEAPRFILIYNDFCLCGGQ